MAQHGALGHKMGCWGEGGGTGITCEHIQDICQKPAGEGERGRLLIAEGVGGYSGAELFAPGIWAPHGHRR